MDRICRKKVDCLDSTAALQLLIDRPTKETKPVNVTVYSNVIAVSEIIQIKDVQLFLVKLLPKLNIICKRKESLQLHQYITPGKYAIFTNLRHTTLQKGSSFTEAVYSVTKETEILSYENVEVNLLTLEEWFNRNGFTYTVELPENVVEDKLFSYTGTITNVLDARLGVFELDNEIRLYIGQVPAVHKNRRLGVGVNISIQNVHQYTSTNDQKLSLFGCMSTSVRVLNQPNDPTEVKLRQTPQILKNYLYLYRLSHRKLEHLYHICSTVRERFSHLEQGFRDSLIKLILLNERLSWLQNTSTYYRNHLDEFLLYPHKCSVQSKDTENYPSFVSVKQIQAISDSDHKDDQSWSYTHISTNSDQILLGTLGICEKTGLAVLTDSTGQMDTVVTCYLGLKHDSDTHICSSDCDCSNLQPGQGFKCPYIHTCCIDKLVAVTKYGIITEYVTRINNSVSNGKVSVDVIKYIVFSLVDAIYLGSVVKTYQHLNQVNEKISHGNQTSSDGNKRRESEDKNQGEVTGDKRETDKINQENSNSLEELDRNANSVPTSSLHRHQNQDGGWYFCRKSGCNEGKENKDTRTHQINTIEDQTKSVNNTGQKQKSKSNTTCSVNPLSHKSESNCVNNTGDDFDIPMKRRKIVTRKSTDKESSVSFNCHGNGAQKSDILETSGNDDFSDASWETARETGVVMIHRKDALIIEGVGDNQSARFCVQGQIVKDSSTSQVILLFKRRAARLYSVLHQGATYKLSIQSELSPLFKQCWQCERRLLSSKPCIVILLFKGRAARWSSVLHQGATYKLSIPAELSPLFRHNVGNVKVMQKLKKLQSQVFMVVNEHVDMEQIYQAQLPSSNGDICDTVTAIKDSPTSIFSGIFKDVQGVILSRTLIQNDNLHEKSGGTLELACLFRILVPSLRLKDDQTKFAPELKLKARKMRLFRQVRFNLLSDATKSMPLCEKQHVKNMMYLKAEDFVSPLGLVPGSVVQFTRLERKVSQLGNIYWRFIPMSSVRVMAFTQTSTSISDQNVEDNNRSPAQFCYLRDVWEHNLGDSSDMFACVCSVQQILKVSLKFVCDRCGSMIRKSVCSNIGCFNTDMGRFLARASILVDDGTSVAMVTVQGDMVRDLLLLLSDKQWEEIQMRANIYGEIFVQQARPELHSDIERFVYQLCDHPGVKRTWNMKMKLKPASKYTDLDAMKNEALLQHPPQVSSLYGVGFSSQCWQKYVTLLQSLDRRHLIQAQVKLQQDVYHFYS